MSTHGSSFGGTVNELVFPVAGRTALIIEDDLSSALALKALLERARMKVVPAADGRTALDALGGSEGRGVGIVLVDIKLPGMDGYEVMAAIRENPQFAELPIIAVTAKDTDGERDRCLAAGASNFIPKPINVPVLLEAIDMLIDPPDPVASVR